jgi:hypothetical protein
LGAVNFFKTKKNRKNWKLYTCIDNYTGQQMLKKKIINDNKKFNKEVEIYMQLKKWSHTISCHLIFFYLISCQYLFRKKIKNKTQSKQNNLQV